MDTVANRQTWALAVGLSSGGCLTAITAILAQFVGHALSPLELAAVFTSYGSTVLFVLQMRQCYIWGAISTVLYAELFRQSGLYGSASVQLYLLGALLYGYLRWGPDGNPRPVTSVSPLGWWGGYAAASLGLAGLAIWTSTRLSSPVGGLDALVLGGSILAQWLLDNKKLETWIVWALVNVIAVYLYWTQGLTLVALQYVYFLGNAVWGFYEWRASRAESARQRLAILETGGVPGSFSPSAPALARGREISERLSLGVYGGYNEAFITDPFADSLRRFDDERRRRETEPTAEVHRHYLLDDPVVRAAIQDAGTDSPSAPDSSSAPDAPSSGGAD